MNTPQLPLGLRFPAHQKLVSFEAGENAAALHAAAVAAKGGFAASFGLSGNEAVGKSHLLIAVCQACTEFRTQYLPLARLGTAAAEALMAADPDGVIAIDDLDAIAGNRSAEVALFDLFNRARAADATLIFAARRPPTQLPLSLPDLVSRLSSLTHYAIKPLTEDDRRRLLLRAAEARGIELDASVIEFLFRRYPRDIGALLATLEHLDRVSLAEQRRLTVPFVRRVMGLPSRE